MKNKACKLFLLGGVSLLALAGCNKQGIDSSFSHAKGSEVVFGTVTRSVGTKTVYSGVVTNKKERIDWEVNDQFRVYSNVAKHRYIDQNWADYKIARAENITANGAESSVAFGNVNNPGIVPITEYQSPQGKVQNGLVWGDPGDYTFWGVYPVPAAVDAEGKAGKFTFSIPTAQDADVDKNMDFAFMTATKTVSITNSETGTPVELAFEPAFTAFKFIIEAEGDPIKLKSFTLTSDSKSLSGDFTVTYNGTTRSFADANDTPKKSITVDLGGQVIAEATDTEEAKTVTFTVLAQPQTFNDLTISFKVNDDNQDRILALTQNGTGVEFGALKKHIIKGIAMPSDLWKIFYQPDFLDVDKWVEIGTMTNVIVE